MDYLWGVKNVSFFDSIWVFVHFGSGLLLGITLTLLFRLAKNPMSPRNYGRIGVTVLVLWEYFELFLRYAERYDAQLARWLATFLPPNFFEIESRTNIISDLCMGALGLTIIYWIEQRYGIYKAKKLDVTRNQ